MGNKNNKKRKRKKIRNAGMFGYRDKQVNNFAELVPVLPIQDQNETKHHKQEPENHPDDTSHVENEGKTITMEFKIEKRDEVAEREGEVGEGEDEYAPDDSDMGTDPLKTDMLEMEWTNDQVISLVTEYRNRPMLWDANNNMFRIQTAKYEAWSQMADIFDCAITDLRKKLNSIFASHRREKKRVRSGSRSTWFLYEHLSFLPTHIENEPGEDASVSSSKKRRTTEDQHPESSEEYPEESEIIIKEEPPEHYQERPQKAYTSPEPVKHIKRKLTKQPVQREPKKIEAVEVAKSADVLKKKDECDSFGEYIAVSLRKHDDRTQAMIKQAINNILFEQEMKKFNSEQFTVVISNAEQNPLLEGDDD